MAVLRSEHCRKPEPHAAHNGVQRHHLGDMRVHCDGTVSFLQRELEREANPPPGPPSPPRGRIDWGTCTPDEFGPCSCGGCVL